MVHKRVFTREDELAFLEVVGRWRRECVLVLTRSKPQGPIYKAAERVIDAIDGVAEVVTGDRQRFHQKSPRTPGPDLPPT